MMVVNYVCLHVRERDREVLHQTETESVWCSTVRGLKALLPFATELLVQLLLVQMLLLLS